MQREREQFLKRGSRRRSFNKRKIRFSSNNGNINLISGISSRDCEYLCKFESTLRALLKNLFHLPSIGTRVILWMFYRRDRTKERKKPMPFERCRWNCIFLEAYLFVVNSRNGYGQTDNCFLSYPFRILCRFIVSSNGEDSARNKTRSLDELVIRRAKFLR